MGADEDCGAGSTSPQNTNFFPSPVSQVVNATGATLLTCKPSSFQFQVSVAQCSSRFSYYGCLCPLIFSY